MSIKGFNIGGEIHKIDYESLDNTPELDGKSVLEPVEDDIPKVFFEGDITGMTKDNEKIFRFIVNSC